MPDSVYGRLAEYRNVLERIRNAEDYHKRRNGLYGDDYVRPGISVEVPLFWGVF